MWQSYCALIWFYCPCRLITKTDIRKIKLDRLWLQMRSLLYYHYGTRPRENVPWTESVMVTALPWRVHSSSVCVCVCVREAKVTLCSRPFKPTTSVYHPALRSLLHKRLCDMIEKSWLSFLESNPILRQHPYEIAIYSRLDKCRVCISLWEWVCGLKNGLQNERQ